MQKKKKKTRGKKNTPIPKWTVTICVQSLKMFFKKVHYSGLILISIGSGNKNQNIILTFHHHCLCKNKNSQNGKCYPMITTEMKQKKEREKKQDGLKLKKFWPVVEQYNREAGLSVCFDLPFIGSAGGSPDLVSFIRFTR